MKCIKCKNEAEYIYVYSLPLTGISFAATGGSLCGKCLAEVKQDEAEGLKKWLELHQDIAKR